jgi:hypothetical protein
VEVTINVSEENWKFLQDLMERINIQDNRVTASPFYYVVATKKEIAVPEGCGECTKYYYEGGCFSEEELKEFCEENELAFEEEKSRATPYDVSTVTEYHNFFFTEEGYKKHMELNSHNYRHYKGEPYSYVMHAFRNPELKQLLDTLGEITGKGHKKH